MAEAPGLIPGGALSCPSLLPSLIEDFFIIIIK